MYEKCVELLKKRGVEIDDIVTCVAYLQKGFDVSTLDAMREAV